MRNGVSNNRRCVLACLLAVLLFRQSGQSLMKSPRSRARNNFSWNSQGWTKEHLTSHGRAQDRSCSSCSRQSCRVGKQKRLHNNALWMTELTISNTCFGLGGVLVVLARA